jgi:acetyltransferase-like isoleucine patch superfamily enzyme
MAPGAAGTTIGIADMALFKVENRSQALAALRRKIANNRRRPAWEAGGRGLAFIASTARSQLQLRKVTSIGIGVRVLGLAPVIHNRGTIRLGNDVVLEARTRRIFFNVWPEGELTLGHGVVVNDGVRFDCTCSIRVGERGLIGYGVVISDSHFHGVYDRVMRPTGKPVVLEDDIWVAANAMIFSGVTVGRGSVVAGGAVVREDVPPFTVVAGNPACLVRSLDPEDFKSRATEGQGSG